MQRHFARAGEDARPTDQKRLYVLDESSLASTKQMHTFPECQVKAETAHTLPLFGAGAHWPCEKGAVSAKLVKEVRPEYTPDLAARRVEDIVLLEIVVGIDGKVSEVRTIYAMIPDLDQLARTAVWKWRFKPGRLNGQPVPMLTHVEMTFKMRKSRWETASPPAQSRPLLYRRASEVTMRLPVVVALALSLAAPQFPPPNIVENGDARGGASSWTKQENHPSGRGQATIETCDGSPCFVVRNHAVWTQFARLPEGSIGKFILVIGRGSSERVWQDDNITGLPYLGVAFAKDTLTRYIYVDSRSNTHMARPSRVNQWETMSTIKRIPPDAAFLWLRLSQGLRRGTPHNGSAARFMDVEARVFDTEDTARAYIDKYNAFHASATR